MRTSHLKSEYRTIDGMPDVRQKCHTRKIHAMVLLSLLTPVGVQAVEPQAALCPPAETTHFKPSEKAVSIQNANRRLEANTVEFAKEDKSFHAVGAVRYFDPSIQIEGEQARLNLESKQGILQNVHYQSLLQPAQGTASKITLQGEGKLALDEASFTTCPTAKPDWSIRANTIQLDQESQQGTASNVTIDFKDVPIFYLPYLRFPIGDKRLSGILFPEFGNTDRQGIYLSLPYYWNIAPQVDATITPKFYSLKGTRLDTEIRYLTESSRGELHAEYLPTSTDYNGERSLLKWAQHTNLGKGWQGDIQYGRVSDNTYLADYGDTLESTSLTHLEQSASLQYAATNWQLSTQFQRFQTLVGASNYQRLPELSFTTQIPEQEDRLNYAMNMNWVQFGHDDGSKVIGKRLYASPEIKLPLRSPGAFFIPSVAAHYSSYDLSNITPGLEKQTIAIPMYSLDMGVFLERDSQWGKTPYLQTLEPRFYYVFAPYLDQSNVPVFDTAENTFSISQMFTSNRFNGPDRIGDANQLAVALRTSLQDQISGQEVFSASLAQLLYFQNRQVTLPSQTVQTNSRSVAVGEVRFQPLTHWALESEIHWDDSQHQVGYSYTRLQYKQSRSRLLNLAYRFRQNEQLVQETSFIWQVNANWKTLASRHYDLLNERDLESVFGIQYDDCCWGIRLVDRTYYTGLSGSKAYNHALLVEFELKGLSSFGEGKGIESLLTNTISGYGS